MAKISNSKKGVLFTLSVMLLGISLLAMATSLSEHSGRSGQAAVRLLEMDRTSWEYSNAEDMVLKALSENSNYTSGNGTAAIEEMLPLKANTAPDLDRVAQFLGDFSELNVSMNLTNLKNGTYFIQPGNTMVGHDADNFFITPQNAPDGAGALMGYVIDIAYPPGVYDDAAWQYNVTDEGAGGLQFYATVHDTNYAVLREFNGSLSKYAASRINITEAGGLVGFIQVSSPGALDVMYTGNISLKASARFANPVYFEANDTITVAGAANRTGKIRMG